MSDQNDTPRDRQPEGRRPAWQSGTPRGQERVVSYESDERYWTDYLRVALPVVGLLLMLGLLFWWANSIIGDENGSAPTSTVAAGDGSEIAVAATNTAVNTPEGGLTPTTLPTETPSEPTDTDGDGSETDGDPPTEAPDCDGEFELGQQVETADVGARFRSGPNFDQDEPPTLDAGAELEITSECYSEAENADGEVFRLWRVTALADSGDVSEGDRGWVAEELLEPVDA